jgi:hypothetical protein
MNATPFVPAAPHLQAQGSAQALRWKDGLKATVINNGGELPGHTGVVSILQQAGADIGDHGAVTAALAQAVGAPAE